MNRNKKDWNINMREYSLDSFLGLLKNNVDCNFVALAVTPLHANAIDAAIIKLRSLGIELNGYILSIAHSKTGRIISKESFHSNLTGISVINYDANTNKKDSIIIKIKRKIEALVSFGNGNRKVYLLLTDLDERMASAIRSVYGKDTTIIFVLIEEGLGSYSPLLLRRLMWLKENSGGSPKSKIFLDVVKLLILSAYDAFYAHQYIKIGQVFDYRIFEDGGIDKRGCTTFCLKRNEKIINNYIEAFRIGGEDIPEEIIDQFNGALVYNPQCLLEEGLADGEIEYNIYEDVCHIAKKLEIKQVLKPHPRDNNALRYESLKIPICYYKCSQEALFAKCKNKPKCLISLFSSTLLNARLIYDIPCISLSKILLNKIYKGDITDKWGLSKVLKRHILQYSRYYDFPEDYRELENLLDKYFNP